LAVAVDEEGLKYEKGSYLRLIDFVYHSTLGSRVIKKKRGLTLSIQKNIWRLPLMKSP